MKKVYCSDVIVFEEAGKYAVELGQLPSIQQERAKRYRFDQDRFCFVLGRMLLKQGLKDFGVKEELGSITYQVNGKPELGSVHFSIAHSEGKVVCVVSDEGPVGIDIEVDRVLDLAHFEAFFQKREWADIMGTNFPKKRFYWYWTRKEAIIKATGKTLAFLHEIDLDPVGEVVVVDGVHWRLEGVDLGEDVFGAICYCLSSLRD